VLFKSIVCECNFVAGLLMRNKNEHPLTQVPRLYGVLRRQGNIGSFQEYLTHLFNPLFECSVHPDRNPKLATLLNNICGFDSVDDESGYGVLEMGGRPIVWAVIGGCVEGTA
jgi:adenosine deaminase